MVFVGVNGWYSIHSFLSVFTYLFEMILVWDIMSGKQDDSTVVCLGMNSYDKFLDVFLIVVVRFTHGW